MAETAAANAFRSILGHAERRKPGAASKLSRRVLADLTLEGVDARGPAEKLPELLEAAATETGIENFALDLATSNDTRRLGLLAYVASTRATIRDAYASIVRYLGVWNEGMALEIVETSRHFSLVLRPRGKTARAPAPGLRALHELACASLLAVGASAKVTPIRVELAFDPPSTTTQHELIYRAPVLWNRSLSKIVFDASAVKTPLATQDPVLSDILTRQADEVLARFGARTSWTGRVRAELLPLLASGTPNIEQVAKKLAVSRRTLQRRLEEEDARFEALLDEVRHELSLHLLADPERSIADVAFRAGFQQLSAFYRAFRRWSGGATPAEHRRSLARADKPVARPGK